jgi:hypothetical protein
VGEIERRWVDGEVGFFKIWWGIGEEGGAFRVKQARKEILARSVDAGKKWKGGYGERASDGFGPLRQEAYLLG